MRTSLNNIKNIEDYILGKMPPGDSLVFQANMLLNKELNYDAQHQKNTYAIIRQYSRKKIMEEIAAVQKSLSTAPKHRGFMLRIISLFK